MNIRKIGWMLFVNLAILGGTLVYADTTVKNIDSTKAERTYNEQNLNISVDKDHREFIIKLESNPTTGYSWYLREYNADLLVPIKHDFKSPKTGLVGAPGYEWWAFEIKPAGLIVPQQTLIRFIYTRSWQTTEDATQLVFHVSTH